MDVITNWVDYIVLGECVGCDGCDQWKDASSFPSYCCLTLALVLFSVVVGSVALVRCILSVVFRKQKKLNESQGRIS